MRGLVIGALVLATFSTGSVAAQGRGKARGKGDHGNQGKDVVAVQVVFGRGEVDLVKTHYHDRYRSLPPGLQKKLNRTGTLPPGWQKKLEPFPPALDRRLGALPDGYIRGVYDGNAVIVSLRTGALIDVAVLF